MEGTGSHNPGFTLHSSEKSKLKWEAKATETDAFNYVKENFPSDQTASAETLQSFILLRNSQGIFFGKIS